MPLLEKGAKGADVINLQTRLKALGFDPKDIDGKFGDDTREAVVAFQISEGLPPDGRVDINMLRALGISVGEADETKSPADTSNISEAATSSTYSTVTATTPEPFPPATLDIVSRMFPGTPVANIRANLPIVLGALADAGLANKEMVLMALATIRAESASFLPISEGISKFNTTPGRNPFNLYDDRASLGNQGRPDGERFKGRGFVQLTGRDNYRVHGARIGLGSALITNPELANRPDIAAKLLASFLKRKEPEIRDALRAGNLRLARRLVNGGSHGLAAFTDAFNTGLELIG